MLKSLFAGVSGLQSHQIAMDVESNNIANVNTVGFKYSRANFSDLLAQTKSIATAPQGQLGGKNPVQIGLGSTVASSTRIFSQGSIQNSDKNTDVAIQGDGFFIISPDSGNTYKYTRSGDLKFDASGNFVDNNGFIAQGWVRDAGTGLVDSTAPITNIQIAPGLTTPASPTSDVVLKANLNSGPLVESFSPAYQVKTGTSGSTPALDSSGNAIASGNVGVMFNEIGQAFSLQANQGVWASFVSAEIAAPAAVSASVSSITSVTNNVALDDDSLNITIDAVNITLADSGTANTADENGLRYANAINAQLDTAGKSGISAVYDSSTDKLSIVNTQAAPVQITAVAAAGNSGLGTLALPYTVGGNQLDITFTLDDGSTKSITTSNGTGTESVIENANRYVAAINAQTATTGVAASVNVNNEIELVNTNANPAASHNIRLTVGTNDNSGLSDTTATTAYKYQYDQSGSSTTTAGFAKTFTTMADLRTALENEARNVGPVIDGSISSTVLPTDGTDNILDMVIDGVTINVPALVGADTAANTAIRYASEINIDLVAAGRPDIVATAVGDELIITNSSGIDIDITAVTNAGVSGLTAPTTILAIDPTPKDIKIEVSVNEQGKLEIINPGGGADAYDMNLKVTAFTAQGITENEYFTTNMVALNSSLPTGSAGTAFSQSFNTATHSSSIDIFDSLGSKHTLRMEFRKTALDIATGSAWDMLITVPEPASIDTLSPLNQKTGQIRFNNDGSLATFSPPNISFSGNNGSSPEQQVNLRFGTANAFDGMTSFDSTSSTSGISQDGFTGGDLVGIRIDQSGTLVGSFSNGRSFGLAQIGMAKFTNNEGLGTEGGNIFVQTANSGDPIIGTAATAGRGFIQSSALEASNVDLSRALTQLIIIQRGYQANGKTITTSDQLLQTLIGLKN
ncbi:MAG: flagellar hook protein FlgE [Sulfurimonas sp.]|jgi:flagellar hook protein FlgE|uniref:flagellar hook-basal body complex protein n=1 Tax=Sulfurimonas sp. TaxID=2022749 RepID=UPI0039E60709